jgi:hypothetical protein
MLHLLVNIVSQSTDSAEIQDFSRINIDKGMSRTKQSISFSSQGAHVMDPENEDDVSVSSRKTEPIRTFY